MTFIVENFEKGKKFTWRKNHKSVTPNKIETEEEKKELEKKKEELEPEKEKKEENLRSDAAVEVEVQYSMEENVKEFLSAKILGWIIL